MPEEEAVDGTDLTARLQQHRRQRGADIAPRPGHKHVRHGENSDRSRPASPHGAADHAKNSERRRDVGQQRLAGVLVREHRPARRQRPVDAERRVAPQDRLVMGRRVIIGDLIDYLHVGNEGYEPVRESDRRQLVLPEGRGLEKLAAERPRLGQQRVVVLHEVQDVSGLCEGLLVMDPAFREEAAMVPMLFSGRMILTSGISSVCTSMRPSPSFGNVFVVPSKGSAIANPVSPRHGRRCRAVSQPLSGRVPGSRRPYPASWGVK